MNGAAAIWKQNGTTSGYIGLGVSAVEKEAEAIKSELVEIIEHYKENFSSLYGREWFLCKFDLDEDPKSQIDKILEHKGVDELKKVLQEAREEIAGMERGKRKFFSFTKKRLLEYKVVDNEKEAEEIAKKWSEEKLLGHTAELKAWTRKYGSKELKKMVRECKSLGIMFARMDCEEVIAKYHEERYRKEFGIEEIKTVNELDLENCRAEYTPDEPWTVYACQDGEKLIGAMWAILWGKGYYGVMKKN